MCLHFFLIISRELGQDDELVFPESTVKVTSKRRPANQAFGLDLTVRAAFGDGSWHTLCMCCGKHINEHSRTHTNKPQHVEVQFHW